MSRTVRRSRMRPHDGRAHRDGRRQHSSVGCEHHNFCSRCRSDRTIREQRELERTSTT